MGGLSRTGSSVVGGESGGISRAVGRSRVARTTENNRRARYYTITNKGRRELNQQVDKWKRFAQVMSFIVDG